MFPRQRFREKARGHMFHSPSLALSRPISLPITLALLLSRALSLSFIFRRSFQGQSIFKFCEQKGNAITRVENSNALIGRKNETAKRRIRLLSQQTTDRQKRAA